MSTPSISFLIPAHNEEKIIAHALDRLQEIAGPETEVWVGLDGCTDGTEEVVTRYDFVGHVELDERGGKPAVLRCLMELARGQIIIVHDADWRFACDREGIGRLIREFEDPRLGGIVLPPHNIPFWELRADITSPGFVGAGLGVLLLWDYLLSTQTEETVTGTTVNPERVVYPFPVNVFRRGATPPATTAADDFERFMYLLDAGFRVKVFNNMRLPYFQITDQQLSFRDHLRQRVKNHIARAQLAGAVRFEAGLRNFHLPFTWYCVKRAARLGWRDSVLVLTWYVTVLLALVRARLILRGGVPDARKAWEYRLTRHIPERSDGT
jgi:glycosyltransferase involved in cell wall biosynthesis